MTAQHQCSVCNGWTRDDRPCHWCGASEVVSASEPRPGSWVELGTLEAHVPFVAQNGWRGITGEERTDESVSVSWFDTKFGPINGWGEDASTRVRPLRIIDPLDVQEPSDELVERLIDAGWREYDEEMDQVDDICGWTLDERREIVRAILRELSLPAQPEPGGGKPYNCPPNCPDCGMCHRCERSEVTDE